MCVDRRLLRLLRKIDLDEVLEELGLEVLWRKGPDAYLACPDPDHDDANPSFHVCLEDVEDTKGNSRLGWFNCWSHPSPGLAGQDFSELVARIRCSVWDERITEDQRKESIAWLRATFLRGEEQEGPKIEDLILRRRRRRLEQSSNVLVWPPSRPVGEADERFGLYLSARGITPQRAVELALVAVTEPGDSLASCLGATVPAVLFPITREGNPVNWFARAIEPTESRFKGRYCPGVLLGKSGVLWEPDGLPADKGLVIVEGIFDAERVRRVCLDHDLPFVCVAVLGGRLLPEQAKRLRHFRRYIHLADGDHGGETLAETIRNHLTTRNVRVETYRLPEGTDPADAPESEILAAIVRKKTAPSIQVRLKRRGRIAANEP